MEKVQLGSIVVSGISVRTNNAKEMEPATGEIGKLWQDFFAVSSTFEQPLKEAYGIYSGYESDCTGYYDVTAGVVGDFPAEEASEITVSTGSYLCFEKRGAMPESVLLLWQEIWQYFGKEGSEKRAYLTDFEKYTGQDFVQIFIGIQEAEI